MAFGSERARWSFTAASNLRIVMRPSPNARSLAWSLFPLSRIDARVVSNEDLTLLAGSRKRLRNISIFFDGIMHGRSSWWCPEQMSAPERLAFVEGLMSFRGSKRE